MIAKAVARIRRAPASRTRVRSWRGVAIVLLWGLPCPVLSGAGLAQAQSGLARTVIQLGDFDYTTRMEASRRIRRLDPEVAVPLLVEAASAHEDSYVQFRAAVLLSGFGGDRADAFFRQALDAPNDRVRAAAYEVAGRDPDPALAPRLLAALDRETSEFVRPSLLRALAAYDDDPAVRNRLVRDIDRGESYFRATVIEALGERRAAYAVEALMRVASQAGPLQDDALLALGRIGDGRALSVLGGVRAEAADTLQPIVSAAACLLGTDCPNQTRYVVEVLEYGAASDGTEQVLLRAAAAAARTLAEAGREDVLDALIATGVGTVDPARAPLALAVGTVALRDPARMLEALARQADSRAALLLLRDAFDMLDEDLAEERFFMSIRRTYWDDRRTAGVRAAAEAALRILEY